MPTTERMLLLTLSESARTLGMYQGKGEDLPAIDQWQKRVTEDEEALTQRAEKLRTCLLKAVVEMVGDHDGRYTALHVDEAIDTIGAGDLLNAEDRRRIVEFARRRGGQ